MAKRTVICVMVMVLMTSTSAYRHQSTYTSHHTHHGGDYYDYYDPQDDTPSPNPISRVDHAPAYSYHHQRHPETHVTPKTNEGYRANIREERPEHYPNHQHSDLCDDGEGKSTDRSQTVVKTAVPINSDVQKVQDDERTRHSFDSTRKSGQDRSINGTGKIVNRPRIHNRRAQPENHPAPDSVVFPGEVSSRVGRGFIPDLSDVSDDCKKMGVCENVTNYPYDHVAQLVAKLGESRNLFKIDEDAALDIAQRIGNDEQEMCKLTQKIIIPQAAPDRDGKWFYILNTRDKPLQGFSVELCEQDQSPCNSVATFITGYEAACKQKYVLRYMTSIDEHTGQTVQRSFKMPSCCSCVVRHM